MGRLTQDTFYVSIEECNLISRIREIFLEDLLCDFRIPGANNILLSTSSSQNRQNRLEMKDYESCFRD